VSRTLAESATLDDAAAPLLESFLHHDGMATRGNLAGRSL
jgi:hypothetical protein